MALPLDRRVLSFRAHRPGAFGHRRRVGASRTGDRAPGTQVVVSSNGRRLSVSLSRRPLPRVLRSHSRLPELLLQSRLGPRSDSSVHASDPRARGTLRRSERPPSAILGSVEARARTLTPSRSLGRSSSREPGAFLPLSPVEAPGLRPVSADRHVAPAPISALASVEKHPVALLRGAAPDPGHVGSREELTMEWIRTWSSRTPRPWTMWSAPPPGDSRAPLPARWKRAEFPPPGKSCNPRPWARSNWVARCWSSGAFTWSIA
jgi:hypothetical protein